MSTQNSSHRFSCLHVSSVSTFTPVNIKIRNGIIAHFLILEKGNGPPHRHELNGNKKLHPSHGYLFQIFHFSI